MECEGEQHFGQLNNMNIESEKERISLNMPSMFCAGCKFSTEDVTSEWCWLLLLVVSAQQFVVALHVYQKP